MKILIPLKLGDGISSILSVLCLKFYILFKKFIDIVKSLLDILDRLLETETLSKMTYNKLILP